MRPSLLAGLLTTAAAAASFAALVAGRAASAAADADGQPSSLTVAEADELVRAYVFAEKPRMNPRAACPVKDVTPKAVWERLGVQVFQVVKGVQMRETFVIRGRQVYRIGTAFGGPGVTSIIVADPAGDGLDKLVFAYGWGSGEHRSQVGALDVLAEKPQQITAPQVYFGDLGDLTVKNGQAGAVEIYAGPQPIGRLNVEGKEGELNVSVRFYDDLPDHIRKAFKETGK